MAILFGGAGFIGSHLAEELIKQKRYTRIIAADIREPYYIVPGVEYVLCDVREEIHVDGDLRNAEIFNLAAVFTTPGHEDWEYFWTNVTGAVEVSKFAAKIDARLIVFTSSISVYGHCEQPRDEGGPFCPNLAYGKSKLLAERIHHLWQAAAGTRRLVIVRPAVIFGPRERGNFTRLAGAIKRRLFAYPGRTDTIKACAYVGELVRSILFAIDLNKPEFTYNLAYPQQYTIREICTAFSDVGAYARPRIVIPLFVMLTIGMLFEVFDFFGFKTSVNRARMRKLCSSNNIAPKALTDQGYEFATDLRTGLMLWHTQMAGGDFV